MRANFFQLGPAGFERADAHHQAGDMRIRRGGVNRIQIIMQHDRRGAVQCAENIRSLLLFDFARGVDHQHAIGGNAHGRGLRGRPNQYNQGQNQ